MQKEIKDQIINAMWDARMIYTGTDKQFARKNEINESVWSRLKNGERDSILKDVEWIRLARQHNVQLEDRQWNIASTEVFKIIKEDIVFCQKYSKAKIFVDECGIGKSYTAKYLSKTLTNCFYIDASQCKSRILFIRTLAKTIGVSNKGKYNDVKADLKYFLQFLPKPIMIIDEAGDLDYAAFLDLKELWNATEGYCGWYMMGADGLRAKIESGIQNKKVGFAEIFSRFSEKYSSAVPKSSRNDKKVFYKKLITDVLTANTKDPEMVDEIVRRCLNADLNGEIGGLRRAEALMLISDAE